ncbi:MAG: HAMP domain-containing histidine kinase [Oscillospiraceae bacterium]|nr:HAMP domain-containing histidine kinase [Oscillospiraceae bacterium]
MSNRNRRLFHLLLSAAAAGCCCFFSLPCALVVLVLSGMLFAFYEALLRQRQRLAEKLCNDVDRILRGEDVIRFDEYKEGELSVLAAEIHKMTIRLREQNAALVAEKQFAKEALEDISHQLRTPLTSVMMLLDLMRSPKLSEEGRRAYLRDLYDLLSRMKWLIETMLSLSRIEADAVRFARERVSCRELIEQSVDTVSVTAELKGVELQTEIDGAPGFTGDLRYTSEALINLLKNAVEHTPPGGTVRMTAKRSGTSTVLTIADTGEGIPEQELPHIFERFYRSSEYTKSGFGIGLAFAKKVISAQGGSLRASNHAPQGALFKISFYS